MPLDVRCGIFGIGIETSVASAEEIATAIENQKKIDNAKIQAIKKAVENRNIPDNVVNNVLDQFGYSRIEDILIVDYKKICDAFADYVC